VRSIAIADSRHLTVTWLGCAKTAEGIEVLLAVDTLEDQRNIVVDDSPNFIHRFDAALPNHLGLVVLSGLEKRSRWRR